MNQKTVDLAIQAGWNLKRERQIAAEEAAKKKAEEEARNNRIRVDKWVANTLKNLSEDITETVAKGRDTIYVMDVDSRSDEYNNFLLEVKKELQYKLQETNLTVVELPRPMTVGASNLVVHYITLAIKIKI